MADPVTAVFEAVRRSQAILADYVESGQDADMTVNKLIEVLDDRELVDAMQAFYPDVESAAVLADGENGERELRRALPGS